MTPRGSEALTLGELTDEMRIERRGSERRPAHGEPELGGASGDLLELGQLVQGDRERDLDPERVDATERHREAGVGEPLEAQHREGRPRRGHIVMEDQHAGSVGGCDTTPDAPPASGWAGGPMKAGPCDPTA